jgi:hypothetical protein
MGAVRRWASSRLSITARSGGRAKAGGGGARRDRRELGPNLARTWPELSAEPSPAFLVCFTDAAALPVALAPDGTPLSPDKCRPAHYMAGSASARISRADNEDLGRSQTQASCANHSCSAAQIGQYERAKKTGARANSDRSIFIPVEISCPVRGHLIMTTPITLVSLRGKHAIETAP